MKERKQMVRIFLLTAGIALYLFVAYGYLLKVSTDLISMV